MQDCPFIHALRRTRPQTVISEDPSAAPQATGMKIDKQYVFDRSSTSSQQFADLLSQRVLPLAAPRRNGD
jgi:hypothetical protein